MAKIVPKIVKHAGTFNRHPRVHHFSVKLCEHHLGNVHLLRMAIDEGEGVSKSLCKSKKSRKKTIVLHCLRGGVKKSPKVPHAISQGHLK